MSSILSCMSDRLTDIFHTPGTLPASRLANRNTSLTWYSVTTGSRNFSRSGVSNFSLRGSSLGHLASGRPRYCLNWPLLQNLHTPMHMPASWDASMHPSSLRTLQFLPLGGYGYGYSLRCTLHSSTIASRLWGGRSPADPGCSVIS